MACTGMYVNTKDSHFSWVPFVFEASVHLINNVIPLNYKLYYWRDGNDEVDYIVSNESKVFALEVKSGIRSTNNGMSMFKKKYSLLKIYVV